MSKIKIDTIGGGIFSKFMVGMQNLLFQEEVQDKKLTSVYFDVCWENIYQQNIKLKKKSGMFPQEIGTNNPFNFVLKQSNEKPDLVIKCFHRRQVTNQLYSRNNLTLLKYIIDNIQIHENILNKINSKVDKDTVGVHIRMTDMHLYHKEHQSSEAYIKKIKEIIQPGQKIFVASDNEESLKRLQSEFDVISNPVNNRHSNETDNIKEYNDFLRKTAASQDLWEDSWLDMLSLSRCGSLIHDTSNLNNAAVIFSNTIKETYKL